MRDAEDSTEEELGRQYRRVVWGGGTKGLKGDLLGFPDNTWSRSSVRIQSVACTMVRNSETLVKAEARESRIGRW